MSDEHEDHENCECYICKNGLEKAREWERECMEKYGWYCHFIFDDKDSPYGRNVHTHGMPLSFGHLDLQIMGAISDKLSHTVLCRVVERIEKGEKFKDGDKIKGIANDTMDILFVKIRENDRDVLRIILPDPKGNVDADKIDSHWVGQYHDVEPRGI